MIATSKRAIGILGGSFDPVHLGHIHLAREIKYKLGLNNVLFIPCYRSAHGKLSNTTPKHRLSMLNLALEGIVDFQVNDLEIKRQNISYTVETLQSLRAEFPDDIFCLILGMDAFNKFTTWHKWEEILTLSHLIVADRKDYWLTKNTDIIKLVQNHEISEKMSLFKSIAGKILFLNIKPLDIQSTTIRSLISQGKQFKQFLPNSVWEYIIQNNLYDFKNN